MSQRFAALLALAGLLALGVVLSNGGLGQAQTPIPGRISFQIATGSTAGTYFPVGQAIAGLISHPPGVGRCETAMVCGPAGVILSARTSDGSLQNLRAVNDGLVDSAISQGDTIAEGVAGRGLFRRAAQNHVRVIAALFPEQVHLVAAKSIRKVTDLRGKRVVIGGPATGTAIAARQILTAFRLPEHSLKIREAGGDNEASLLAAGKIDAFFLVAGAPIDEVREALAHGAHLVPIDGPGRTRLVAQVPQLSPSVIAGVYPGPPVESVATRAYWITRDSAPDALIYGIARALFNPANSAALKASHPAAHEVGLDMAAKEPPAPLHQGAARYYREMGKLPRS